MNVGSLVLPESFPRAQNFDCPFGLRIAVSLLLAHFLVELPDAGFSRFWSEITGSSPAYSCCSCIFLAVIAGGGGGRKKNVHFCLSCLFILIFKSGLSSTESMKSGLCQSTHG